MSLATTIGAGALMGGLAFAVYAAAGPTDPVAVSAPAPPSFAPVPTPTVTRTAEGCVPPAVLTRGECLITTPGPAPIQRTTSPRTTSPRTRGPRTSLAQGDEDGQRESDDERGVEPGDDDELDG